MAQQYIWHDYLIIQMKVAVAQQNPSGFFLFTWNHAIQPANALNTAKKKHDGLNTKPNTIYEERW